ncbi:7896_t:CDS:2, partial [Funneliformis caledonium]
MELTSSENRSKLKYPEYAYWIEKQSQLSYINKHNSHTTLGDELRNLKQIFTSSHSAYNEIDKLLKGLQGPSVNEESRVSVAYCGLPSHLNVSKM